MYTHINSSCNLDSINGAKLYLTLSGNQNIKLYECTSNKQILIDAVNNLKNPLFANITAAKYTDTEIDVLCLINDGAHANLLVSELQLDDTKTEINGTGLTVSQIKDKTSTDNTLSNIKNAQYILNNNERIVECLTVTNSENLSVVGDNDTNSAITIKRFEMQNSSAIFSGYINISTISATDTIDSPSNIAIMTNSTVCLGSTNKK